MTYDEAVAELYQAPHAEFVATRKRLAGELKTAGDKAGSTKLGKAGRPNISAWVVNQLYWQARDAFDHLLETAARIRGGELAASGEHREAIGTLRARASELLDDAGHGATEGTLRRVATTLSALAVAGGFDPDPPGALADDRDPPGFDAITGGISAAAPAAPAAAPKPKDTKRAEEEELVARRKAEEAARAKKASDRNRLDTALRTAKTEATIRDRNIEALREQLVQAERIAAKAHDAVAEIEADLAALDEP